MSTQPWHLKNTKHELRYLPPMRGPDLEILCRLNLCYLRKQELKELIFQMGGGDLVDDKRPPASRRTLLLIAGELRDEYLSNLAGYYDRV